MNKDYIRRQLQSTFLSEEKAKGLKDTEAVQKDEKEINDKHYKDVKKKMKEVESATDNSENNTVKFDYSSDQKEYHDDMEIRNGMEMLQFDGEVPQAFKDRNEMYIAGDSKTGNKTYTGEWNPETGEGNGNTESVWGASNDTFGQNLIDTIKRSAKKRDDANIPIAQMGDDIEVLPKDTKLVGDRRKVAVEGIKRLNYKKEFNGMENALNLIPESYKVDNKVFEMCDGNESYRIRWEGNLSEGSAVVLRASSKELVNEDINKMKHLMGYKSQDSLGRLNKEERLDENQKFGIIWEKTKSILSGSDDINNQNTQSK